MIYHVPQTVQADIYSLGCTLLCALDSRGFELGGRVQVSDPSLFVDSSKLVCLDFVFCCQKRSIRVYIDSWDQYFCQHERLFKANVIKISSR